jgi:hypothetical protein
MTYEEDVREALKQGPGSVKQIRKAPKTSKPTRVWEAIE